MGRPGLEPSAPAATPAAEVSVATGRGLRKQLRDFAWLLRGELLVLREGRYWYLIQASFVPVSYLLFLWIALGRQDADTARYLLTGSSVMSLSFTGMLSLGQHLGFLKDAHAFDYYAALPISRVTFIAAITTRGLLLALPSALTIVVIGRLAFGLVVPPQGYMVLLLSAYALCGLGAFIGFWSPTARVASLATQILQTVITLFAPVFVPRDVLPAPLRLEWRQR